MSLKVLLTGPDWFGDLLPFCERGCRELGADVRTLAVNAAPWRDAAARRLRAVSALPLLGPKLAFRMERRDRRRLDADVNRRLSAAAREFRPDVLLALLSWKDPIRGAALDELKGVVKIAWLMDDPFLDDQKLLTALGQYDHVYVPDPTWADVVRLWTDKPVGVLPCGADLTASRPLRDARPPEGVVFVGSSYGDLAEGRLRQKLLRPLASLGLRLYGDPGWRNVAGLADCYRGGPLNSDEVNRAYNEAKVVINIHHPQWRGGTSLRTFSICASGAFQLVDWRPGLEEWLAPDREVVAYRDGPDLQEKARAYLADDVARNRIARAGCERVRGEHTYGRRLRQMFDELGLCSPQLEALPVAAC